MENKNPIPNVANSNVIKNKPFRFKVDSTRGSINFSSQINERYDTIRNKRRSSKSFPEGIMRKDNDEKPYIDAKIEATEAKSMAALVDFKSETREEFSKVNNRISSFETETRANFEKIDQKLDHIKENAVSFRQMVAFTATTILSIAGILLAVLSYGSNTFNGGMSASALVAATQEDNGKKFNKIDDKFKKIDAQFEQVDKRFEQVDKRFEQVDKQFEQVDKRFDKIENILGRLEKKIDSK